MFEKKRRPMAHKYLVTLCAGEDGYIVAECPSLPGCVSQGNTREEALKNIQEAIEGIIEVRKAQQLPIPSPDIVEISVAA
jgi:predicted RNase H-like HicB family nuclease